MNTLLKKCYKVFRIVTEGCALWFKALRFGVAASVEHSAVLRILNCKTVIDLGANKGQFALASRYYFPEAKIFSFEPLLSPAEVFRSVFKGDSAVVLHSVAIGPKSGNSVMHVSACDDSSSLLPISSLQEEIFPGTGEVNTVEVVMAPLDSFLGASSIDEPALLKLDVQGFELEALQGCETLLSCFEWIYCECSFVELYSGQRLASDVMEWLFVRGFYITGMYNPSYDRDGQAVQADFLFRRIK